MKSVCWQAEFMFWESFPVRNRVWFFMKNSDNTGKCENASHARENLRFSLESSFHATSPDSKSFIWILALIKLVQYHSRSHSVEFSKRARGAKEKKKKDFLFPWEKLLVVFGWKERKFVKEKKKPNLVRKFLLKIEFSLQFLLVSLRLIEFAKNSLARQEC